MTKVVGVKFRDIGKSYYFDPGDIKIKKGDYVIVETARGQEYGFVSFEPRDIEDEKITLPLKSVIRIATKKDAEHVEENLKREKQSKIERLQKIKKAQDLIALSKDQDKIIADLESQIEIEGVDFGEK